MIIGICGPEGAGKSLAARILAAQMPGVIHPFAAPLKKMLEALGVDGKHLYGSPENKLAPLAIFNGKSARHAMQTLGTEWGRNCIDIGFWVRAWGNSLPSGHVIADDVRFETEAEAVRSRGGIVIKIIRDEADLTRATKHSSENFNAITHDVLVLNDKCPTILGQKLAAAIRVSI